MIPDKLKNTPRHIHTILIGIVYSVLIFKAFAQFPNDWDYLVYHLVGALQPFGLTTYTPEPRLQAVNLGWPPLAHLMQGALVWLVGDVKAAGGANALCFVAVSALLFLIFRDSIAWRWYFTSLLGVPLFILHFTSGYTDLIANCFLAAAFAIFLKSERLPKKERLPSYWLFLTAILCAMFCKIQSWPIVAILSAAMLLRLWDDYRQRVFSRRAILALAIILVIGTSCWPVRNMIWFSNPTYPAEFPLLSSYFPNYIVVAHSEDNNPRYLRNSPHILIFFHSLLELNRLMTDEPYSWSIDQYAVNKNDSPHQRMGGWFFVTMVIFIAGFAAAIIQGLLPRTFVSVFLISCLLTSLLPQSHELRYWLYIPLTLAFSLSFVLGSLSRHLSVILKTTSLLSALYVLWQLDPFRVDNRPISAFAPPEAVAFWHEQQLNPSTEPQTICGKMPNTIYWSGPTFNEFRVVACQFTPN